MLAGLGITPLVLSSAACKSGSGIAVKATIAFTISAHCNCCFLSKLAASAACASAWLALAGAKKPAFAVKLDKRAVSLVDSALFLATVIRFSQNR